MANLSRPFKTKIMTRYRLRIAAIKICGVLLLLVWSNSIFAQQNDVDFIRSVGKIYVVIAVLSIIFIGLLFYLFKLDQKLKKLEQKISSNE